MFLAISSGKFPAITQHEDQDGSAEKDHKIINQILLNKNKEL